MKWLAALVNIINFTSWIFDIFKKWQFKREARAEITKSITKEENAIKDETDKIINSSMSDADLDKRLQDGKF